MSSSLRIIFMGTPEFAVASLKILVEHHYNIVAVVTAADKPAGRGRQLQSSPVKQFAIEKDIPVLQPEKLKAPEFIKELKSFQADLFIVVAFRMLPEIVWSMPPKGTFNLHGSLLPQYRGAAPINHAIINGETVTGVTSFFLQHEIDTGNIIFKEEVPILPEDNAGTVHDKLMEVGAQVVLKTVKAIENNSAPSIPQDHAAFIHHAPKIFKDDCKIDWSKKSIEIHNFIRGLSPYPTAFTVFQDKILKVYTAKPELSGETQPVGTFESDGSSYLRFKTVDGWLYLLEVQAEGKKRMDVGSFLRGIRI